LRSAGVLQEIRTEPTGLRRNRPVWYRTGRFGTKPAGSVKNRSAGSVFVPVLTGRGSNRSNRPVPVPVRPVFKTMADPNLYYHIVGDECLILVLYVDDLFLAGSERLIAECKRSLTFEFEMKDLGMMHYFLGLEVR
jgi:hypothetical protein